VVIHTDGWIELDTKQLDRVAEFNNSAHNFHSARGVHLVTLRPRATQHRFRFRRVENQLVLQEPPINVISTLRDRLKRHILVRLQSHMKLCIIGILMVAYRMCCYNGTDRRQIQSKQKWF